MKCSVDGTPLLSSRRSTVVRFVYAKGHHCGGREAHWSCLMTGHSCLSASNLQINRLLTRSRLIFCLSKTAVVLASCGGGPGALKANGRNGECASLVGAFSAFPAFEGSSSLSWLKASCF